MIVNRKELINCFLKETVYPAIICLVLGLGFGLLLRQEQLEINESLSKEYNELRTNYDKLISTYQVKDCEVEQNEKNE